METYRNKWNDIATSELLERFSQSRRGSEEFFALKFYIQDRIDALFKMTIASYQLGLEKATTKEDLEKLNFFNAPIDLRNFPSEKDIYKPKQKTPQASHQASAAL